MKKIIAILLCMALLLSSCSARSAPTSTAPQEPQKQESQSTDKPQNNADSSAPQETIPSENPTETPAEKPAEEKTEAEKDAEKEASDDNAGESASGVFQLLDSGYEITLNTPFMVVYDSASDGLYISAVADPALQGIVSYTADAEQVRAIEENITVLNETLKNDSTVHDFKYDRTKDINGLYSITFSYRTEADEVSDIGYNYVLYRQTDDGMITVMFTTDNNKYDAPIQTVFQSVIPLTEAAVEPPER